MARNQILGIDTFLSDGELKHKVPIRFFIENKFADKAILERLPPAFAQHPQAQSRILQMVKRHVANHLDMPGLKFFEELTISEDFEHDGQIFVISFYLLPPRRPAPVRAHARVDKPENFATNVTAQPFASGLTLANILVTLLGFSLSLLGFACDRPSCQASSTYGQLVTAFASLSMALLEVYLSFFSTTYN
ncbi:hypothetical protein DUNSADRAFT_8208 [Dunaliella salina]|uniref:Uncharacterized protein n=1 Tax=Dunaliella salina TaxID=3046 RepID=A0ABQ7GJT3_DUNSA|nr:hypothetical protein DUNSADRAFT_8208 [Dunaliella salina]|eukprot:KAF5834872.1 hypothetical protein DUNSADRAFT_8208 [Dunaliella salina]